MTQWHCLLLSGGGYTYTSENDIIAACDRYYVLTGAERTNENFIYQGESWIEESRTFTAYFPPNMTHIARQFDVIPCDPPDTKKLTVLFGF